MCRCKPMLMRFQDSSRKKTSMAQSYLMPVNGNKPCFRDSSYNILHSSTHSCAIIRDAIINTNEISQIIETEN